MTGPKHGGQRVPLAGKNNPVTNHPRLVRVIVLLLLGTQTGLIAWIGLRTTPTVDEVGHLPAGLMVYELGRFDGYKVNPPLVKLVAALPVWAIGPEYNWTSLNDAPGARPEWRVGGDFIRKNGPYSFLLWTLARWMCIPFIWIGGWACFRWSAELHGVNAGLVALTLWCLSPNIIAWGATIGADAAAASIGLWACYTYRNWVRSPSIRTAIISGLVLGLAELTKSSLLILYLAFPVIWLLLKRKNMTTRPPAGQLGFILCLSVIVINAGYNYEGTLTTLGEYRFFSATLGGGKTRARLPENAANRFAGTLLGDVPVPFPRPYVEGLDLQKVDLEMGAPSYMAGVWKSRGWWYWYLFALMVKVPVGTLVLLGLTTLHRIVSRHPARLSDDALCLIVPPLFLFLLVSSQTGFTIYFRYVVPCLPFAFVYISRVASRTGAFMRIAALALACSVISSLWIYPHSLAFFNVAAGGPQNGHTQLLQASIEFGQNGLYLRDWLDQNQFVTRQEPIMLDVVEFEGPHLGIRSQPFDENNAKAWAAISVTRLFGPNTKHLDRRGVRPFARIGYGVWIFEPLSSANEE